MKIIKIKLISTLLYSGSLIYLAPCYAETIYQYQDKRTGHILLSNKKKHHRYFSRIKATHYPKYHLPTEQKLKRIKATTSSYHHNKYAFDPIIQQAAQRYHISAALIKAVIHTESAFNIYARSPMGAQGLMQLMPATAQRFQVNDVYDPYQNIMAGAKYLSWLLQHFNGNIQLALAGYNAGEANVAKYGGIPPFKETQHYVQRVMQRWQNLYANKIQDNKHHALTSMSNKNTISPIANRH